MGIEGGAGVLEEAFVGAAALFSDCAEGVVSPDGPMKRPGH